MGTALTGLQISSTYNGLLKTTDNAIINAVLRVITDGLGTDTALSVSTLGIKSTGTLEVTGATTSTGLITSSTGNSVPAFTANGATTGWTGLTLANTGGTTYFATESSVGGTLVTGSTAYDALIRTHTGLSISANGGAGTQFRLSAAGLAVTGVASCTGALTTNGGLQTFGAADSAGAGFRTVRVPN